MSVSIAEAYDAALRGDLGPLAAAASVLGGDAPLFRAWREASRGLHWFVRTTPTARAPVDVASLMGLSGAPADVIDIAARALSHEVRAAAVALDPARVSQAARNVAALAVRGGVEARAWASVAAGWRAVMDGTEVSPELEAAGKDATRIGRAELVLEATSVRALLPSASIDEALLTARRASRMARTESLPHSEYLANLALARCRRLSGKPHLATRILLALRAVAPAPWRPWLDWELTLSTGRAHDGDSGPSLLLAEALLAARQGSSDGLARAWRRVEEAALAAPLSQDLGALRFAFDPTKAVDDAPAAIRSWALGEGAEAPRGLFAVDGDGEPSAYVLSPTAGVARRILALGVPLVRARGSAQDLAPSDGAQLRTDSAVAALALARPNGLTEDALFRTLYGFEYEPARHQAVRDTLYNRVRKRALPMKLERDRGRVWLAHPDTMLVPDPRTSPPAELNILRVLAERAGAAAKEVADELQIPLRTAQDALKRLAEDGAVKKERAQLGNTYVLEDTTFTEPTHGTRPEYLPPEHTPSK